MTNIKRLRQRVNRKYSSLFTDNSRYFILMGGRSAGRSYVASQYASTMLTAFNYFRCAVMRFILGDVRNSIFKEVTDRFEENEMENTVIIKDLEVKYLKNLIKGLGFRKSSGEQKSKLKSLANYNCVIIEEADEISEEDFMQLDDSLRTLKSNIKIILCLNVPHKSHWIIKRFFNLIETEIEGFYRPELKEECKSNTTFIHTTYLDNLRNINQSTIDNFEAYKKRRPDYYYSMIMGLVSEGNKGRIFTNWKPISRADYEALDLTETYGLDFGFTNDPTALSGIKKHNRKLYIRELLYETGLTNKRIAKRLEELGVSRTAKIYADSQEPKSIEEIKEENWNIEGAIKGTGSVSAGLDMLLDYDEVYYVEDSTNLITEQENYVWALDRDKNPTNDPVDKYNHLMDGIRYNVYSSSKEAFVGFA